MNKPRSYRMALLTVLQVLVILGVANFSNAQSLYYPYANAPYPYNNIFDLTLTTGVLGSPPTGWTPDDVNTYAKAVIDLPGNGSPQVFQKIWDYFCYKDLDPNPYAIDYIWNSDHIYRITAKLYDATDWLTCCPCGQTQGGCCLADEVRGFERGFPNYVTHAASITRCDPTISPPFLAATVRAFGHELHHLIDAVNKNGNYDIPNSELHSTTAEYVSGQRWNDPPVGCLPTGCNNIPDYPLMNALGYSLADGLAPYDHYRLFSAYIMQKFSGAPGDTDDLVYKWIRHTEPGPEVVTSFLGLAKELNQAPYAALVPGATESEKMASLYQRFAIARYADDEVFAGGLYGFIDGVEASSFRMMRWADHAFARARVVPPTLRIGGNLADGTTKSLSLWQDPLDPTGSNGLELVNGQHVKRLYVNTTGSSYLVFLADPEYFATNSNRRLHIRLRGLQAVPPNQAFRVGYVTYDSYGVTDGEKSDLLQQPILEVVEDVGATVVNNILDTQFDIEHFGSERKGVLVVLSMVQQNVTKNFGTDVYQMKYEVEYSYANKALLAPSPYATLQAAMTAADQGDTVVLSSGATSMGSVILKPGVLLQGAAGPSRPILNANGGLTAVSVSDPVTSAGTRIAGLTITGFVGTGVTLTGGGGHAVLIEDCDVLNGMTGIAVTNSTATPNTDGPSALIRGCVVSDQTGYGIRVASYDPDGVQVRIEDNLVRSTAATLNVGIAHEQTYSNQADDYRIEGNSVRGWVRGITIGNGPISVRRNLVTACGGGIQCGGSQLTLEHNNAWGNGVYSPFTSNYLNCNGQVPTGNLAVDPRLCSQTDMTLNLTSPCARFGNDWGEWIGANKYVSCASGVLSRTVSVLASDVRDNALTLTSDLEIASSKTLTVGTGLTMKADNSTEAPLGSGIDANLNEIIVHGHLTTSTSGPSPTFSSTAAGSNPGYWFGIVVKNGGSANLFSPTIENSVYGLYCPDLAGNVIVTGGTIRRFSQRGIQINQVGSGSTANLTAGNCAIDVTDGLTGILLLGAQSANVSDVTITGDAESAHGVQLGAMGTGGSQAVVKKSTISGFSTGRGIRVEAGSPFIKGNSFTGCKWGVELRGSGSPSVVPETVPTTTKNTLTNCTTGIYVGQNASPLVDRAVISNTSTAAPIGVYTDSISTGSYTGLTITGHQIGFKAYSTAAHSIVKSSIIGFGQYGVQIPQSGIVTIGCSGDANGNSISSGVGGVLKYVSVKTPRLGGLSDICAESNYWGEAPPPASKFGAHVDYEPWLTSIPPLTPASVLLGIDTEAATPRVFRVAPNPFTGSLRFSFSVPIGSRLPVRLEVFDLAGRLIWQTQVDAASARDHEIEWSGRTGTGAQVSAGIFFARLSIGSQQQLLKVVKVQ